MYVFFFSISNWFTYFYIQQDNIKKLTKNAKTSNNTKTRPQSHLTKAKQRYKNPDNIEEVYIQLRFPDCSQLNELKEEGNKTLWKQYGNLKT